ncbi:hypothetical protein FGO68_gene6512 [Halteria grandinella]|uniref:Uncharacterized protein n=1 Tax=Halteria grandinella TaxID=5974 RepID=A0A8J8NFD9_HALGN|nr:hypothetical protein FGO68_gene6512 [Halteria grandinella]
MSQINNQNEQWLDELKALVDDLELGIEDNQECVNRITKLIHQLNEQEQQKAMKLIHKINLSEEIQLPNYIKTNIFISKVSSKQLIIILKYGEPQGNRNWYMKRNKRQNQRIFKKHNITDKKKQKILKRHNNCDINCQLFQKFIGGCLIRCRNNQKSNRFQFISLKRVKIE